MPYFIRNGPGSWYHATPVFSSRNLRIRKFHSFFIHLAKRDYMKR